MGRDSSPRYDEVTEKPYVLRMVITILEIGGGVLLVSPLFAVPFLSAIWGRIEPLGCLSALFVCVIGGLYMRIAWGLRRKYQWARIITMLLGLAVMVNAITLLLAGLSIMQSMYSAAMIGGTGYTIYWFAKHPKEFR